jgi:hypothetical protein
MKIVPAAAVCQGAPVRCQALPTPNLEPFLHGSIAGEAIEGHAMIVMSIALCAGVFYWLGFYKLAFWILIYATVYGGLGVLRGDNRVCWAFRGDSGPITAALIPVTWHIGVLAGYL